MTSCWSLFQSNSMKPQGSDLMLQSSLSPTDFLITKCTQHSHNGQPLIIHLNQQSKEKKILKGEKENPHIFYPLGGAFLHLDAFEWRCFISSDKSWLHQHLRHMLFLSFVSLVLLPGYLMRCQNHRTHPQVLCDEQLLYMQPHRRNELSFFPCNHLHREYDPI